MGDPKAMAEYRFKVVVNGELHSIGTEKDCYDRAQRLEQELDLQPEDIRVELISDDDGIVLI